MAINHTHHIVPLHMGGTDDANNLIELTVSEHAEAHRNLFEKHGLWQDELAWKGLAGIINHEEAVRLAQSKANKGKVLSEETKRKLSEKMKGRKLTAAHKSKVVKTLKNGTGSNNSMFGKKAWNNGLEHSAETREKIRLALIGSKKKLSPEVKAAKSERMKKYNMLRKQGLVK